MTTPKANPEIEVAAGVIFRDGKLLITQRHPDAHLGGLWEFPGGKREPGESFEECLARELVEELGIEVTIGRLIETVTQPYPGKTVHLRFFHCMWKAHEPQTIGCEDIRWVTPSELLQYEFPEADKSLLHKLTSEMALWKS